MFFNSSNMLTWPRKERNSGKTINNAMTEKTATPIAWPVNRPKTRDFAKIRVDTLRRGKGFLLNQKALL